MNLNFAPTENVMWAVWSFIRSVKSSHGIPAFQRQSTGLTCPASYSIAVHITSPGKHLAKWKVWKHHFSLTYFCFVTKKKWVIIIFGYENVVFQLFLKCPFQQASPYIWTPHKWWNDISLRTVVLLKNSFKSSGKSFKVILQATVHNYLRLASMYTVHAWVWQFLLPEKICLSHKGLGNSFGQWSFYRLHVWRWLE